MKKYWAIFRMRFINNLQYRTAAVAGLATNFAWGFMLILSFSAIHRANPAAFPMEFSQMVSYIWIQQALLLLFAGWFRQQDVESAIIDGMIAYDLVRPVDLYGRWLCQNIAVRAAGAALRCAPVLVVAFIVPTPYRLSLPPDMAHFMMFLISAALSLCVAASFSMLLCVTLFYTLSLQGAWTIFSIALDFLGGQYIPLPFFPAPIRAVLDLSPFAAMQNMPLRIYIGNITGQDALIGIALQIFWLVILQVAGRLAMRRALKKVIVQGG